MALREHDTSGRPAQGVPGPERHATSNLIGGRKSEAAALRRPRKAAVHDTVRPASDSYDAASGALWADPRHREVRQAAALGSADLLAAAVGLGLAALITGQPFSGASLATLPLIVLIMKMGGRYDYDAVVMRKSSLDETPVLMGLAATYALAWSLVTIAFGIHSSRGAVLVLWGGTVAAMFVLRTLARGLTRRIGPAERLLVIGSEHESRALARRLGADPLAKAEIVGRVDPDDIAPLVDTNAPFGGWFARSDDLNAVVAALDVHRVVVTLSGGDPESVHEVVATATTVGVKVSIVPSILEVIGSAAEFDELGGVTVLSLRRLGLSRSSAWIKRGMDLIGAALGLIITAPLGLLIAVAIKLDGPGPIFYRQQRIGRGGQVFDLIKFRSMVDAAEVQRPALEPFNESEGIFKMSRDPRVTRVGRFLRQTSMDELPQLINVLRGEMSIVGPRPLVLDEDRRVRGRHRIRLQYAPGMTGPWQVLGPTRPPLADMVKLDYLYGANWSVWSDLKYILRTVSHVVFRRGL